MMDKKPSRGPAIFGKIGFVGAILALIFSLIPCMGLYAIVPGFAAIVFCIIPFLYVKESKQKTRTPLLGLIIAVLAIFISVFQYYVFMFMQDTGREIENKFIEKIEESIEAETKKDTMHKNENDSVYLSK